MKPIYYRPDLILDEDFEATDKKGLLGFLLMLLAAVAAVGLWI